MTPAENLRCLLDGGSPAWVPFSIDVGAIPGFTEPLLRRLKQETGSDDPAEFFDCDYRTFSLRSRFGGDDPRSLHSRLEPGTTFDEWGIGHWAGGAEATYEKMFPPLVEAKNTRDIDALPSPVIEPADRAPIEEFHRRGYLVFGYAGSIYEWSWWLRGMENFMADLVADPGLAEAVIAKVAEYTRRLALETARAGVDVLCFYDDAGMQSGMQISPDLWRRFIKPAWRDVLDSVRSAVPGARFFLHSCGNIRAIVPDIVDVGFNVLHPIQPECMDVAEIYRQFGRRIVACTTLSAQRVFPFGTPDDVRAEVRRLLDLTAGDRRGFLLPSNRIQPETPWENVVAFALAAKKQVS